MKYRIWYSTEEFADFIIDHTDLQIRQLKLEDFKNTTY